MLAGTGSGRAVRRMVLGALNAYDRQESAPPPLRPELWGLAVDAGGRLACEGLALQDLAREYGTPLHVVSRGALERTFNRFHDAFSSRYPRVSVAYSYKTNPLPGVLRALHECGADAEVISHYELWLALELGVPPQRIVFNGPAKTAAAIELAVERGIKLINIDGVHEIAQIEASAARHGRRQAVGVRIVTSVGWAGQFGFRLAEGAAAAVFDSIRTCPHLDPCGLHLHLGTDVKDARLYFQAAREAFAFAALLRREVGVEIRHFDLGGGFGVPTVRPLSSMELRFLDEGMPVRPPRPDSVPQVEDYAAGIIGIVNDYLAAGEVAPPEIILEPGRALTSSAQCLLLGVLSVKTTANGTRFVIADGGRNLTTPLAYEYHQLFAAAGVNRTPLVRQTICGPLCHPSDIVAAQRDLPLIEPGDVVAVMDAGAYFIPNQTNFSNPRPAAAMIAGGAARLIRQRESFHDLLRFDAAFL
jgi:diaminopimelate decarboxylase